jgi:hypothetical protein
MNYLIDPRGHWWRWPSATLAEQLGYTDPDFDLAGYATRNLGFVSLLVEEAATLLQFRAGAITREALDSLKPYLAKAVTKTPVALVFYASGWLEEIYVDAAPLLARMDELSALSEPRMRDQFIRRAHQPRDWLYHAHKDLTGLFELWRFVDGVFDLPVQRFLQTSGLIARTVILDGNRDDMPVAHGGSGISVYDSFSFTRTVGRSIADQPDQAYGQWVAQAYRECRLSGMPQIDDIDAIIDEPGHDTRRRRYQRLILRWQRPNGDVILTGSSMINQNIAIPFDGKGGPSALGLG